MSKEIPKFTLPLSLIGKAELSQMIREVETIDAELQSQKVRLQGQGSIKMPNVSEMLSEFLEINKINLTDDNQSVTLKSQLSILKDKAPVMHFTFASVADPKSLEELAKYVRSEINPIALISVGLQPGLIGGAIIRTPSHVHDFSMRSLFSKNTDVIVQSLEELTRAAG
jgi:F0F1-type ATP synthase delta subunit